MRPLQDTQEVLVVETELVRLDRERRRRTHSIARSFLQHFGSLVRQLGVHNALNSAVQTVLDAVMECTNQLREHGHVTTFVFAAGHTFCDGVWVRCSGRSWETSNLVAKIFDRMKARGYILDAGANANSLVELARTIRDISRRPPTSAPILHTDVKIEGVTFLAADQDDDETGERARFRREAFALLDEGLRATDRKAQGRMDIFTRRRQRALVLRLVQLAERSPEDLLLLTTLRDPSLPTTAHVLMVTILAIALGRALDLRRRDLLRLGVAALSHNLGETKVSQDVLNLPRELTPEERKQINSHPLAGARHLLEQYGFDPQIAERAIASIEHHRWANGRGYPNLVAHRPHLFSQIIAVADVFDALCQQRPFRPDYPPDQAIKLIGRFAGPHLETSLVRGLIRIVGKYPPGSLVELDTGEYALVLGPGEGQEPLNRPRVLLLTDDEGYELEPFIAVDLGERHPRRRAWLRTIMRPRDPRKLSEPVSAYILADRVDKPIEMLDSEVGARTTQRNQAGPATAQSATHQAAAPDPADPAAPAS